MPFWVSTHESVPTSAELMSACRDSAGVDSKKEKYTNSPEG